MKKKQVITVVFFLCSICLYGIMTFFPDNVMYYHSVLVNGRALGEGLVVSQSFAITQKRQKMTHVMRKDGYPDENVGIHAPAGIKIDFNRALQVGTVQSIPNKNRDCIIYKKSVQFKKSVPLKSFPDYTYVISSLNKLILVYGKSQHNLIDFDQFCTALKIK